MTGQPQSNYTSSMDHFFRGAFSIDLALFRFRAGNLELLLQEKEEVIDGLQLGLPGALILPDEDTKAAVADLSEQLIGRTDFYHEQLSAFSELHRHPLGRVITIAYYGLISNEKLLEKLGDDLRWYPMNQIPKLSYDHNQILESAISRFKEDLLNQPIVAELLPKEFILADIISIYEQAFQRTLNQSNFRKSLKRSKLLVPSGRKMSAGENIGRPAELYSFANLDFTEKDPDVISFNF
jgi:8-oxo-dGTP diphosphatase